MKKLVSILLAIILIVGFIPAIIAEDNTTSTTQNNSEENSTTDNDNSDNVYNNEETNLNEDDLKEIKSINTPLGAYIRLLQLKKSIYKNIIIGEETIKIIEDKHSDFDTTKLNSILDDLQALVLIINQQDNSSEIKTLTENYVGIKKQSIELSQNFKTEANTILTEDDKQEIRQNINLKNDLIEEINSEIKEAIRNHNMDKFKSWMKRLENNNDGLRKKLESGQIDIDEAKNVLIKSFKELPLQKKEEIKSKVKENITKQLVSNSARIEELVNSQKKITSEIRTLQKQRVEQIKETVKNMDQKEIRSRLIQINNELKNENSQLRKKIEENKQVIKEKIEQRIKEKIESTNENSNNSSNTNNNLEGETENE
jgi:hypothetical protein